MIDLFPLFSALSSPSRVSIVDILLTKGYTTGTILAKELGFDERTISDHLGILFKAGLLLRKESGREVLFTLKDKRLVSLLFDTAFQLTKEGLLR